MQKDLFGDEIKEPLDELSQALKVYDSETFEQRYERLKYINKIFPHDYGFLLPPESAYVLDEAKMTFISGQYIATVMLAQAFIEHILQLHLEGIGQPKIAKRGLSAIVKFFLQNKPQHNYIMTRIDKIRKFRNPFSHLKPFDHPERIIQKTLQTSTLPDEILEKETKEALEIMYHIAITDL